MNPRSMIRRLLSVGYAWMVGHGLLAVCLPKRAIELNGTLLLRGYENPGDLEPTDWYVRSTRVAGLGMLVTGVTGLLAGRLADGAETELPDDGDEPVELDI